MVKFKSRYILLEILSNQTTQTTSFPSLRLKPETLADRINKEVNSLYGDRGTGLLKSNFQVKYLNEITNLVIIRVSRDFFPKLHLVLTLMKSIENKEVRVKILHVSGTIKKIEEVASEILSVFVDSVESLHLKEEKRKLNFLNKKTFVFNGKEYVGLV